MHHIIKLIPIVFCHSVGIRTNVYFNCPEIKIFTSITTEGLNIPLLRRGGEIYDFDGVVTITKQKTLRLCLRVLYIQKDSFY